MTYQINKKELFFILIILTLALSFRALYLKDYIETSVYPVSPYSDGYYYFLWAKDIASGDIIGSKVFMKWPLYAYFLAFLFKIFFGNILSVYLLQSILGATNCVLVYLIAKRIFNGAVAFISGLLCACYGLFVFYDGLLLYTSLSLFLNSLLFLLILRIRESFHPKKLFLAGILLGICAITQPNIILFGVLTIIWVIKADKITWKKQIYSLSCFIAGLFIILGSVALRNYAVENDFVLIAGNLGFNLYVGNNPDAKGTFSCPTNISLNQEDMLRDAMIVARIESGGNLTAAEFSNFWLKKAINFIRHNPKRYLRLLFNKFLYIFSPKELMLDSEYDSIIGQIRVFKIMLMDLKFILALGFLGIILGLKKLKETAPLYILLATLSFSLILFFVITKLRIMLVPGLMIFAAFGIYSLGVNLRKKRYLKFLGLSLVSLGFFALLDRAPKNNISLFEYHLMKARGYEEKRDYQYAIGELQFASQINPDDRRPTFRLGLMYFYLNNLKAAEEEFKKVVAISPLCVDAYYNLGFLYNQQQRFAEATEVLEKAVSLDPESAKAHFELGITYKAMGRSSEAKKELSLALKNINRWRTEERAIIEKELQG